MHRHTGGGVPREHRMTGIGRTNLIAGLLTASALVAVALPAAAQDATWLLTPGSGNYNTGANWSTGTVPTGTAFFGASNTTALAVTTIGTQVGGWTFNAGASSYTFTNTASLNFNGNGIINGGSATITNNLNSTIFFNNSSSAGAATITNDGLLNFFGVSTAGSAGITNNHGLTFFATSTAANANITNNDIVSFNDTSTAGNATIINDANVGNTGGLLFNHDSTAGNATIISNTFLGFTFDASAGSATITNNNGGLIRFMNTSTGGVARFVTAAGSSIDLSFLSSSGTTAGSIEGAGSVSLGSKNLAVGGNNLSTTFSGVLQDGGGFGGIGGSLTKTGTGTLTLSGINTYTGATKVDGGALIVNGALAAASTVTVNNGGKLGGTGTVGNVTVASGGTFAPGSGAPGSAMTVDGSLAFASGAFYLVQINAAGQTSKADVAGAATLTGGSVQAVLTPGSYTLGQSFNILHAAGGLGGTTFTGVSNSLPNFATSLGYTATDVLLTLTGATLGAGIGLNGNQQNVATAINGFFNSGGTLPANFLNLFGLTGSALANTLTQLSGEAATGVQQGAFQLGGQFMGLMLDPFVDGRGGAAGGGMGGAALGFAPEGGALPEDIALAYAKVTKAPVMKAPPIYAPRWSAWGGGFGGYNRTDGDPGVTGSHDLTARTAGFAAGLDYRVAPGTVAGVALAGGGTKWDLAQGMGGGKSDAFQAGVYAATRAGPAYVAAALAFGNHWMSTERVAPFGSRLTADFDAQSIGGRIEGGYRWGTPAAGVTPYAALQAQSFRTPNYQESDPTNSGFALGYNARTGTDTRSELGARFDHVAAVDRDAVVTLRGRLAWAHDWMSNPSLAAVFQALPGAGFIVNGAVPTKDAALASAGAELRLAGGVTLIAKFDGDFAQDAQTYAGTGIVRWAW